MRHCINLFILLKKTKSLYNYGLSEEVPYPGAKSMYLVDTEDKELITKLVSIVINDLNNKLK